MTVEGTYPFQIEDPDPLAPFTAPPKNETELEKLVREQQELHAKYISDRIDEDLNGEKAKAANRSSTGRQIRVLVLGHRASGGLFRSFFRLRG